MKIIATLIALTFYIQANAQFTTILNFNDTNGSQPSAALISDGTYLYGMTQYGGANDSGVIFKIKLNGTGYTDLFDFGGLNGNFPYGALYSDGTYLYGMSTFGGAHSQGNIFKLKPDGTGFTKLWDFNFTDGGTPFGSLISDGTFLYGMTTGGGANNDGVIFKIKPDGNTFTKLLDFDAATGGINPASSLLYDGTYLYGTTQFAGANGQGTVFKIKPDGNGYVTLMDFSGGANGGNSNGFLISDGTYLYGMTTYGGANADGTVFRIKPDGNGYEKLLDFDGTSNGRFAYASLTTDGTYLYGMNGFGGANDGGTVFKIKPDGSGYEKLVDFGLNLSGINPYGTPLIYGGILYGMTDKGGTDNIGTIFRIQINGCIPAVGGLLTAMRDTICQGTQGNLTLSGNSGNPLQWQSSVDSVNYTNTGDTTVSYKTSPLQQTTWFRVAVDTGNCSALSDTLRLYVPPLLTADFTYTKSGKTVTFENASTGAVRTYNWNFGDGNTTNTKNPAHTYASDTVFYVCLTVYDGSNCSYTYCQNVDIGANGISSVKPVTGLQVYPNPFNDKIAITGVDAEKIQSTQIMDILGREMTNEVFSTGRFTGSFTIDTRSLLQGIYFIRIKTNNAEYTQRLIKQ